MTFPVTFTFPVTCLPPRPLSSVIFSVQGPIAFAPTYKFTVGTTQYSSGAKVRTPAWCDRVLFVAPKDKGKGKDTAGGITHIPGSYRSHPDVLLSDHKPVSAAFVVVAVDGSGTARSLKLEPAEVNVQSLARSFALSPTHPPTGSSNRPRRPHVPKL